jgi:hypothetical protein
LTTQKNVIKTDQITLKTDRGNATAIAADKATLKADRLYLTGIHQNAKTKMAADQAASKTTVANDTAILKTDLAKLKTDRRIGA